MTTEEKVKCLEYRVEELYDYIKYLLIEIEELKNNK